MHGSRKNRNQANAIKHSRHFLARRRAMADRYFNFKTKKTGSDCFIVGRSLYAGVDGQSGARNDTDRTVE